MIEVADQVTQWGELFLVIAGVLSTLYAFLRFSNRQLEGKIIEEIKNATRQIHPESNGGRSLNDLHHKIDEVRERVTAVETRLNIVGCDRRQTDDQSWSAEG